MFEKLSAFVVVALCVTAACGGEIAGDGSGRSDTGATSSSGSNGPGIDCPHGPARLEDGECPVRYGADQSNQSCCRPCAPDEIVSQGGLPQCELRSSPSDSDAESDAEAGSEGSSDAAAGDGSAAGDAGADAG